MSESQKAAGRLGLTLVGAYFGPFGAIAGTLLGSFLLPPDAIEVTGARLADLTVSLSRYGDPIKIVYGSMRLGGSYIWATDIIEKVSKKTESAKGGQKVTTRTFKYFGNFAIDICESPAAFPIDSVPKIFANADIIVDTTNTTGPTTDPSLIENKLFDAGRLRIQFGAEDQQPDILIESFIGVGNTPAGRGVCRLIFDLYPLKNVNNIIPQITALVSTAGTDLFPAPNFSIGGSGTGDYYITQDQVHIFNAPTNGEVWKFNSITRDIIASDVTLDDALDTGASQFIARPDLKFNRFFGHEGSGVAYMYDMDSFQLLGKTAPGTINLGLLLAEVQAFGTFGDRLYWAGATSDLRVNIINLTPDPLGFIGKELQVLTQYE